MRHEQSAEQTGILESTGQVLTIPLTKGFVALIDAADYELVSQYKWFASGKAGDEYACRHVRLGKGSYTCQPMHRFLLNAPPDMEVDHRDGCKTNNTRDNLRLATRSQNAKNLARQKRSQSPYKGVDKTGRRWRARIVVDGRTVDLGAWLTPEEAAASYNRGALEYFGSFARLNVIPTPTHE